MRPDFEDVLRRRYDKSLARNRFAEGFKHAKHRFTPANLATEATEKAKEFAEIVVDEGVDTVVRHKWKFLGAATLAGLITARKPIKSWLDKNRKSD